jgi:hypothetical protein
MFFALPSTMLRLVMAMAVLFAFHIVLDPCQAMFRFADNIEADIEYECADCDVEDPAHRSRVWEVPFRHISARVACDQAVGAH